ncbi:winged helix-turn-helix transcriptional regulator [Inediibacterium massiliense]|uniref:siroheme decarboxylase subunit beta n=1 Tax=Inediibacterium massiliense TaxID=1658111 RepID=UPI0006B5AAF3|nr:winged helix-turn-helix transcriptional regulator [Inediibacterium massiliense]
MDKIDQRILIEISQDIEICMDFYGALAKKLNLSEEELLKRLKNMEKEGYIKRIAPVLYHQNTEYKHHAMTAWKISESKMDKILYEMKKIQNISHIYERKINEDWPYNLFGMIHGREKEEIENIIEFLSKKMQVTEYTVLYTKQQWKKTSPNIEYFIR